MYLLHGLKRGTTTGFVTRTYLTVLVIIDVSVGLSSGKSTQKVLKTKLKR